jgi:hypothetical protein
MKSSACGNWIGLSKLPINLPLKDFVENRMNTPRIYFHTFLTVVALLALIGCHPKKIPNSSVLDTSQNRAIVKFLGEYQKALEQRSPEAILKLVSKDYLEDNASDEVERHYNYDGLKKKLEKEMSRIKDLRVNIYVQNIQDSMEQLLVVYYYQSRALMTFPAGDRYMQANDVNQMVLRKKGPKPSDGFEIISGL